MQSKGYFAGTPFKCCDLFYLTFRRIRKFEKFVILAFRFRHCFLTYFFYFSLVFLLDICFAKAHLVSKKAVASTILLLVLFESCIWNLYHIFARFKVPQEFQKRRQRIYFVFIFRILVKP